MKKIETENINRAEERAIKYLASLILKYKDVLLEGIDTDPRKNRDDRRAEEG